MERGARPPPVERDGIVVGRQDFGESDRILRVLTPGEGRVSVLARGARSERSRWAALDVGCRALVRTRPGRRDLEPLVEAEVTEARVTLRGSLARLALAAYACELAGALAREAHPEPRLFGLLETFLLLLDAAHEDPRDALLAGFEAKALTFAGVAPVLTRCVACAEPLDPVMLYAPSAGGLLHRRCAPDEATTLVTREHAEALEAARRRPLAESLDLALPSGPSGLLHQSIAVHLGRALHARTVLDALV